MATWDVWYIDEGFLIWIIPLTYLSRESIIWACTTSFIHTCIYRMFNLFTACTYTLHTAFYVCFQFQIHRYIWFIVVPLIPPYVICTCILGPHHLIMYMCTCYARHLTLLYVLVGFRLTTLDSHIQILETRPWWPYCRWSECVVDPSVMIGVQQKLGFSPQLFLPVSLLFSSQDLSFCSWAPLSFCISLFMMYFYILWWCNISVILYHSLW